MTREEVLQGHIDWLQRRLEADNPMDRDIREDLIGLLADYRRELEHFKRFRAATNRSLQALPEDQLTPTEGIAKYRLLNTPPSEWLVQDMSTVINADKRINHPFISSK